MVDIADLNPVFAGKINDFLTAAQKAGTPAHIISAYRDKALQAKLYADYQAGRGGVAAPPGASMHNYGLATDVLANNGRQQDLIAFANAHPELGIKSLGAFDPPHFQLAGDQRALMANPPAAPAGFVAPNLSAWLGGSPATQVAQGTTINSVPSSVAAHMASTPITAAPAVAAAPSPTIGQNLAKGDVGAVLAQLSADKKDAAGNDQSGTSALDGLAGITKPKEQPQQQSAPMLQPSPDSTTAIAPAAQQLLAQTIAQSARPLHWSTLMPGAAAGPQAPINPGAGYV